MIHELKIKYHVKDLQKIEKIEKGDWIDLRSAYDYEIRMGEFKLIDLGVSIKVPKGYEAHLVPRSSTFMKYHLIQTNSIGIIDESYCGESDIWKMPVIALEACRIEKNDRVCQFRILPKMESVLITEVENMIDDPRGGFGGTGVK